MKKTKLLLVIAAVIALIFALSLTVSAQETYGWVQNSDGTYSYIDEYGNPLCDTEFWLNDECYRFDENGIMITGWHEEYGDWYYHLPSGEMARNEVSS